MTNDEADSEIRFAVHQQRPLRARYTERAELLTRQATARVGDWSEQELEMVVLGVMPEGRSYSEAQLRKACLLAGDMDASVTFTDAAAQLGCSVNDLVLAAQQGELAACGPQLTSEARLGAWLIAAAGWSEAADQAYVARLLYCCGRASALRQSQASRE